MKCPRCGFPHVTQRRAGEVAGGKLGALFGASIGAARAMRGARFGAVLGTPSGPAGTLAGGLTGAIVTGIFAGSLASTLGSAIGHLFDREVLNDRECDHCGNVFRSFEGEFASVTPSADPQSLPTNGKRGLFTQMVTAARAWQDTRTRDGRVRG